jgi:hypothetical protein
MLNGKCCSLSVHVFLAGKKLEERFEHAAARNPRLAPESLQADRPPGPTTLSHADEMLGTQVIFITCGVYFLLALEHGYIFSKL